MSYINKATSATRRPNRTSVAIPATDDIGEALDRLYGAPLRTQHIRSDDTGPSLTHDRVDAGPFAIEHIRLPGEFEFSPDPLGRVVALWATAGRVEGRCDGVKGEASAGEVAMVSQHDRPHYCRSEDLSVTALLLSPAVVASVAAGVPAGRAPRSIRFDDFRPVTAAAARLWMSTVEYVENSVLADDALATPLVIGHASRLLAAVTLSTFPTTAGAEDSDQDRIDTRPALLRRAVDYLDRNADNDIALADVAEAIHVTPRAVQYMFRKHLDTTPLQYLRDLRLHRAHQDLLNGNRTNDTVTAIAARWGFMHSGRFAVLHRETYGQTPHTTLRS